MPFLKILSRYGQMNLKVKATGQFSIPTKIIPRCIFGANLAIPAQIHYNLCHGQAIFPRILRQNDQMTLKVKVNDTHFQYQPRVSRDVC